MLLTKKINEKQITFIKFIPEYTNDDYEWYEPKPAKKFLGITIRRAKQGYYNKGYSESRHYTLEEILRKWGIKFVDGELINFAYIVITLSSGEKEVLKFPTQEEAENTFNRLSRGMFEI